MHGNYIVCNRITPKRERPRTREIQRPKRRFQHDIGTSAEFPDDIRYVLRLLTADPKSKKIDSQVRVKKTGRRLSRPINKMFRSSLYHTFNV